MLLVLKTFIKKRLTAK